MPYLLRDLAAPGVGRVFRRVGARCCFLAGVGGCGTVFGREVGKLGAWTSEEVAVIVEDEDSSSDVAVEVSDVSESVESVVLAESWDLSEVRSESEGWESLVSELVELSVEEVAIELVDELEDDAGGVEGVPRRGLASGDGGTLLGVGGSGLITLFVSS